MGDVDFFAPIQRTASKWSTRRRPEFYLHKAEEKTWSRLQKEGKQQWIKVDWGKWADSDEEDEKGAFDTSAMEGMDFSSVDREEIDGVSDDRDSMLADLDEEIAVDTDE